ncbi:MAG TPA: GYD domain-containing protein [Deltaproteobacteria bacterium]|nr:GYD domain-containing protein [Deltaproteobacteria bacterium]HPR53082.1 GYD domain-containing protein [Deltaproteobacteria bacterium]
MARYIILTQFSPHAFNEPEDLKRIASHVSQRIKRECPQVEWKDSYATLGCYDVIDVVESKDPKDVEKAVMIIRSYGHSITKTLHATPWNEFLEIL